MHNDELKDTDPMPWGQHKGTAMANVPAKYLLFLWDNRNSQQGGLRDPRVRQYIFSNLDALRKEAAQTQRKQ